MTAPNDAVLDAALTLAASRPWDLVTLGDIAREAKISLAELRGQMTDKFDLIEALHARLDGKMLAATGFEGALKDRLFDLFMARFDGLQENRAAYVSIFEALKSQPKSLARSGMSLLSSMRWVSESAGLNTTGFRGETNSAVLALAYGNALRVWIKDDAPDMAATMASLDKGLDRAVGYLN